MITYHVGKKAEPPKPVQLTLFSYGELYGCKEVWKSADEVLGIAGYAISSEGRVRGKYGRMMAHTQDTDGYNRVLYQDARLGLKKTVVTHRLVAMLFCHRIEGSEVVHHKDGNKKNNAADNLEWTTYSMNTKYYHENK